LCLDLELRRWCRRCRAVSEGFVRSFYITALVFGQTLTSSLSVRGVSRRPWPGPAAALAPAVVGEVLPVAGFLGSLLPVGVSVASVCGRVSAWDRSGTRHRGAWCVFRASPEEAVSEVADLAELGDLYAEQRLRVVDALMHGALNYGPAVGGR